MSTDSPSGSWYQPQRARLLSCAQLSNIVKIFSLLQEWKAKSSVPFIVLHESRGGVRKEPGSDRASLGCIKSKMPGNENGGETFLTFRILLCPFYELS